MYAILMSDLRLSGASALITGGASGIGFACARAMAREGAHVILSDMDPQAGLRAAAEVGGRFQELDVRSEAHWERAIAALTANETGLDILVNNAGIGIGGDITKLALADWRRQMAVNLDGTFLGMKHALPLLRAARRGAAPEWRCRYHHQHRVGDRPARLRHLRRLCGEQGRRDRPHPLRRAPMRAGEG